MPSRQYADFDVLLRQVGDAYEGRVLESPVGQTAEVRFAIPFSDLDLERFLLRIGHARRRVRSADSQRLAEIRDFGGALFDALFKDQIGTCLRRSLDRIGDGDGLRIRLRLPSNRLADVPWEFLYDRSTGRFLSLSEHTPVVRYMELSEATPRVRVDGPLRMLVIISSPTDYPGLDVEHEWANLEAAVSGLVSTGRLEIERLARPTLDMLQRRLRQEDYHVLHYIGHGGVDGESGDGVLVLEDETGMSRLESGRDLSTLLYDERSMQLAVLNSCEGARAEGTDPFAGTAQALVRQGVAAVLAMQFEITDESAIVFARNFYEALADGFPVDAATNAARKAVFAASRTEWGTPVLYMRAPDGELFRGVTPKPVEEHAAVPQPRTEPGSDAAKVVVVPLAGVPSPVPSGDPAAEPPAVGGQGADGAAEAEAAAQTPEVAAAAAGGPGAVAAQASGGTVPEVGPPPVLAEALAVDATSSDATTAGTTTADATTAGTTTADTTTAGTTTADTTAETRTGGNATPGAWSAGTAYATGTEDAADAAARPHRRASGAEAVAAAREAWEDTHPGASRPTSVSAPAGFLAAPGEPPTSVLPETEPSTREQPSQPQPSQPESTREQPTREQPTREQPTREQSAREQSTREQSTWEQPTGLQPTQRQPTQPQPTQPQPTQPQPTWGSTSQQPPTGPPRDPQWPPAQPPGTPPKRRLPAWVFVAIGVVVTFVAIMIIGVVVGAQDGGDDGGGTAVDTGADTGADTGEDTGQDTGEEVVDPALDEGQVSRVEDACVQRLDGFADFGSVLSDPSVLEDPDRFQAALENGAQAQREFLATVDDLGSGGTVEFAREDEQSALDALEGAAEANRSGDASSAGFGAVDAANALGSARDEWSALGVDCTLG